MDKRDWISVGKVGRPVLCPDLVRQRCAIEFLTDLDMSDFPLMEKRLTSFLTDLSASIGMKIFIGPVSGIDYNEDTKESGPSALVGWTTSDASVHSWPNRRLVCVDIFSCKRYSVETVLNLVKDYFNPTELVIF